jgi:hypothetical protein
VRWRLLFVEIVIVIWRLVAPQILPLSTQAWSSGDIAGPLNISKLNQPDTDGCARDPMSKIGSFADNDKH